MALLTSVAALTAADLPKLSSGSNVTWYFIKFANSGNVLEARPDAQNVKQAGMTGRGAQLWKFEGNLSTGCTITNKLGQQLYVTSQRQNGMVVASKKATTYKQFVVLTSKKDSRNFEIPPATTSSRSTNGAAPVWVRKWVCGWPTTT